MTDTSKIKSNINNPDNSLPYHLRGAFREFETALTRYLKTFDLPVSHFYILRLQWRPDGNRQKDLAKLAFMSESVASQVIQKMENRNLVRRAPDREDARTQRVFLTYKGKALREKIVTHGIQLSDEHRPKISREDMKTAIEVLIKVRESFEHFNQNSV